MNLVKSKYFVFLNAIIRFYSLTESCEYVYETWQTQGGQGQIKSRQDDFSSAREPQIRVFNAQKYGIKKNNFFCDDVFVNSLRKFVFRRFLDS